ncbi:unnamed protein product, partial [Laminaria digitata]
MLRAHKRKTRRISGGGGSGRSVSPRPSLRGPAEPALRAPTVRKSNTAPSSPREGPARANVLQAPGTTWNQRSLPAAPPPAAAGAEPAERETSEVGASTSSAGGGRGGGGGPGGGGQQVDRGSSSRNNSSSAQQQQQHERQSSEPTMGSLFTEWFQKLFSPNDSSSNNNSASSSAPATATGAGSRSAAGSGRVSIPARSSSSSSSAAKAEPEPGNDNTEAASAAAAVAAVVAIGGAEKASDDDVRSNKTSVATSDARPLSPTRAVISPRSNLGSSGGGAGAGGA